jgi:AcrR family transcriptional regulator
MTGNKNTIIKKAYSLFLKKGFNGTSMREICKSTNLSMGGIYAHFTNKEDLFKAVFKKYHPFNNMPKILSKHINLPPEEYFATVAFNWLDQLPIQNLQLIYIDKVEFQGKFTKYFLHDHFAKQMSDFITYIKNNISLKTFKPHKAEFIIHFFFKILLTNVLPALFFHKRTKEMIKEEIKTSLEIFLYGVLT